MGEAISAIGLLSGLGSFGKGLGLVLIVVVVVVMLRTKRSEEERARRENEARALDDVQGDYAAERARRIAADATVSRYLDALRIWSGFAHQQRHAHINERQDWIMLCHRAGIVPLKLPDVPPLPPLAEEREG